MLISLNIAEHFNKNEALNFFELCRACLKPSEKLI